VRRQVGRVVAAVAVLGALVGGCGSGPSQLGSAVIVGGTSVSLDTVQEQITVALGPDKAAFVEATNQETGGAFGPPDVARRVVGDAVRHELLNRRAAEEGISVDEQLLDEAIAASSADPTQGSIYSGARLRDDLRDGVLAAALGARYVDRLGVSIDAGQFATEDEAQAAAQAAAAGGPGADAVFAGLPQGQRLTASVTAAQSPGDAAEFVFGTPQGAVVVLQPQTEGAGWQVYRIVERRDDLAPNGPSAVGQLSEDDLRAIGYRLLQQDSVDLGVRVNPRFGVWDPIRMQVVADDATLGTIVYPPSPE